VTLLTPQQTEAVDVAKRHLDTCVTAGPGSGKTTVLVEYFRRLVEKGVDPLRILAITFTEKAAANMRDKLAQAFHENTETRARLERAWVSTVHGFCARLLRENAIYAGIDPDFAIADERDSWRMQQDSVTQALDELFSARPAAMRSLMANLYAKEFEEALLSAYDAMRGAGTSVDELSALPTPRGTTIDEVAETVRALRRDPLSNWTPAQKAHCAEVLEAGERLLSAAGPLEALRVTGGFKVALKSCKNGTSAYKLIKRLRDEVAELEYSLVTDLYAPERTILFEALRRFDALYRSRKRDAGVLDYADLEEFTVRLLEQSPAVRKRLQAQFEHILMDEFQDTNGQQARLLRLIRSSDNFYAVGDINQSIFGFRHADPEVFRSYRDEVRDGGRRVVELTDNFRSRAAILRAVETITNGSAGIEPRPLIDGRRFEDERPLCVELMSVLAPDGAEARWVAHRLLELRQGGKFLFRDFAVLVRNTEVLPEFTNAFDEAGIPYVVNRGRGFYEGREVNDLVHLLRVIANPRDEISLATVLRSPLAGISDEALLQLKNHSENLAVALSRVDDVPELTDDDRTRLVNFRDRLTKWRERREYAGFDRLLLSAMDDCGYASDSGSRALANMEKLLAQARAASGRMSIDEFIEELSLVRASNPREQDAPPEDSANTVKIMTVHSAKGLEFPIVFLAAMHKGVDSAPPVISFAPGLGLGARWRHPGSDTGKDDLFQHVIREAWKQREEHEGNRLLYVAMTRAEQHLVLSFTVGQKRPGNWARIVSEALGVDINTCRDETTTLHSPEGQPWLLRTFVAAEPPPALPRVAGADRPEATEFLDPPVTEGQEDTNATITALRVFANCPRAYYLGNYLGFEGRRRGAADPDSGEPSASELGNQVHALLAGMPLTNPHTKAIEMAQVFRQSALGARAARATRSEREFDFLMAVDGLVLRGQVDLWFEEGGELMLVDYKTDAVSAREAHQRAGEYALQLRLYAMAVEQVAGRPPDRALLHFLRPNTVIPIDLSPSLLDSPEQVIRDFRDAQESLNFPLNEAEHCRRCPFFRDLCPATLAT
jgi:ATP-dependent exoDNAse (exonuclease V) beta subunit